MRLKITINYPCPDYSDQISNPIIINWVNDNYHSLPDNLLYFTIQVENQKDRIQPIQIGIKLIIRRGTSLDFDRLRELKADIVGWSYPQAPETHYLTSQTRFRLKHYWVSIDSFVQALESNRQIKPPISGRFLGIGGLSGYFYRESNTQDGLVITNSKAIFGDLKYNQIPAELVDYHTYQISVAGGDYQTILVNIGIKGLTPNLKNQLSRLKFQRLYYIGCQVEKNRQDLEYFLIWPDKFEVTEVEYEKVWLFTVTSLPKKVNQILVPLGVTCCVAYNLDRLGLRCQAFPFDWVKMTVNQLLAVLEDDFQKWFELKVVKTSDQHPLLKDGWEDNQISTLVVQNSYGIKFFHDFRGDLSLEAQLSTFIEKYERRINRFRQLLLEKTELERPEFILYSHRINPASVSKLVKLLNNNKLTVICQNEIAIEHLTSSTLRELKFPDHGTSSTLRELKFPDHVRILKDDGIHPDWKLSNFDWDQFAESSNQLTP